MKFAKFSLLSCALALSGTLPADIVLNITPDMISLIDGKLSSEAGWTGVGVTQQAGQTGLLERLRPGAAMSRPLTLAKTGNSWLRFSVTPWGKTNKEAGEITLRVKSDDGSTVIAETKTPIDGKLPFVSWSAYTGDAPFISLHRSGSRATDGNQYNEWVSTSKTAQDIYFDLKLVAPFRVEGLRYFPRRNPEEIGQVYDYEVWSEDPAGKLVLQAKGSWEKGLGWKTAKFSEPVETKRLRLIPKRTGVSAASPETLAMAAAEIEPIFVPDISTVGETPPPPPAPIALRLPAVTLQRLRGRPLILEILNSGRAPVALGDICVSELPADPVKRTYNARRSEYVDLNALGLIGRTSQYGSGLQVQEVALGSPAQRGGLSPGDVIVAVDSQPLPSPILDATSTPRDEAWLATHPEPFIARPFFKALREGRKELVMDTWNAYTAKTATYKVPLPESNPGAWDGFPLKGEKADQLRRELIEKIVSDQKADGSWGGMPAYMDEAFGMLALLGTKDPQYAPAIHKAADFLLATPTPGGSSPRLSLWDIAFRTIALGEYALATGDPRAIAWLDTANNALVQGVHVNRGNYFAFGHDYRTLPYGTSGLVAPLSHLVIGDSLSRRAGIKSELNRLLDPYLLAGWAGKQPPNRQYQAYGSPNDDGAVDQAWCRSGLVALSYHLRGEHTDVMNALTAYMKAHNGFLRRSHGYGNPGSHLGLMALAGSNPEAFQEVMAVWAPMFAMQWVPGKGLRHVESQITNTFAKDPESSARLFSYSFAVVLSSRNAGLHCTGSTDRNWLPLSKTAIPPAPSLIRTAKGVRDLRPALAAYVTAHYTTDGTKPTAKSPVLTAAALVESDALRVAYESKDGRLGPSAVISTKGPPQDCWKVIAADCAFPSQIQGFPDVAELAVERAQNAFDANPSTWLRTNNGIPNFDRAKMPPRKWTATVHNEGTPFPVKGWIFPKAPSERKNVDDSVKSVMVESSTDGKTWTKLYSADVPKDRRVILPKPVSAPYFRLSFLSYSGGFLILPDPELLVP